MEVLIIGYGSIGNRHARLCAEHGHSVTCITGNKNCPFPRHSSIATAIKTRAVELAIVANATINHRTALEDLFATSYTGTILVEKPLFEKVYENSHSNTDTIFVAYNLRFHPLVQRTIELLQGKQINSAQFYVGQYLPHWRPETDYRKSYSAHKNQGGGVLRDLSHELDLVLWMLGSWTRVTAIGGHFSDLEISSDDVFSLLLKTKQCPVVSVHLDYLNNSVRRGFNIIAEDISLNGNFVTGTLTVNDTVETFVTDQDTTYAAQLKALTRPHHADLCTWEQGYEVLQLIDAAETAAQKNIWVEAS